MMTKCKEKNTDGGVERQWSEKQGGEREVRRDNGRKQWEEERERIQEEDLTRVGAGEGATRPDESTEGEPKWSG